MGLVFGDPIGDADKTEVMFARNRVRTPWKDFVEVYEGGDGSRTGPAPRRRLVP
jgi:hypothetical protein